MHLMHLCNETIHPKASYIPTNLPFSPMCLVTNLPLLLTILLHSSQPPSSGFEMTTPLAKVPSRYI